MRPDLVLLDIWMPDVDGITLLKEWSAASLLSMPVIMMSGHGTIDTAVEATKHGAMAFLEKPITLQKLLRAVEQGLAKPAPRSAPPVGSTMMNLRTTTVCAGQRAEQQRRLDAAEHAAGAGPAKRAELRPGPPAARGARRVREELLRVPPGAGKRLDDARGREDRLERTHLYRKLKQLGVDLSRNKRGGCKAPSAVQL
jgi:DNA-binding NtrC family response regulator